MEKVTTRAVKAQAQQPSAPDFEAERKAADVEASSAGHEGMTFELRNAVNGMDCMAQEALVAISTIARLALLAMEQPVEPPQLRELIAGALSTIWSKADDAADSINDEAERVGCAWVDSSALRRLEARRAV